MNTRGAGWAEGTLRYLKTGVEVGKTYMVWDPDLYRKQGNHDVGDNSQCFAEAVVLACPDEYTRPYASKEAREKYGHWEVTATVRFLHSGRVSRGHFTELFRKKEVV